MSDDRLREFVSAHEVCWEVSALREAVADHGVQSTGLEFNLFARYEAPPDGGEPPQQLLELHACAAEIARRVLSNAAPQMLLDIEPPHVETHMRPETQWATEVEVRALLTPADPEMPPSQSALKALIAAVEREMAALGVHRKSWTKTAR